MTLPPLLTIDGVSLSFGDVHVLRDVTATVGDIPGHGQVVALLGPSGIGKTQLAMIVAGLQAPTSGRVLVGPKQEPVRRGDVGVVAQNYPLFEWRTVLGNLMLAARRTVVPRFDSRWGWLGGWMDARRDARARAMATLERFGMAAFAGYYPAQLSGGQRQRVAIAQQFLCAEHFIILDEPTTGLDPVKVDVVCALIGEVAAAHEENTLLVVTHDIRSALKVADTVWMLGRNADQGASIRYAYDLGAMGLAWHPDVSRQPAFVALEREVRDRFKEL